MKKAEEKSVVALENSSVKNNTLTCGPFEQVFGSELFTFLSLSWESMLSDMGGTTVQIYAHRSMYFLSVDLGIRRGTCS